MEERACQLLTALEDAGFEAYVVGGAVRDLLMGKEPHDYDITTSARPEDIRAVAEKKAGIRLKSMAKPSASSSLLSVARLLKSPPSAAKPMEKTATVPIRSGMPIPCVKTSCAATSRSMPWPWIGAAIFTTTSAARKIYARSGWSLSAIRSAASRKMPCGCSGPAALLASSTSWLQRIDPGHAKGLWPRFRLVFRTSRQ